jgi:hypothetical protein
MKAGLVVKMLVKNVKGVGKKLFKHAMNTLMGSIAFI